jgi:ABC-type uncharacterized transport system permease subunit
MEWAAIVGLTALWLLCFWYLYVLVMGLYRAYLDKRLKPPVLYLAAPALVVGYTVDLISNWTIATVVFRELPASPLDLVTDRLSRYISQEAGWRSDLATWICTNLLDVFDPSGKHCK